MTEGKTIFFEAPETIRCLNRLTMTPLFYDISTPLGEAERKGPQRSWQKFVKKIVISFRDSNRRLRIKFVKIRVFYEIFKIRKNSFYHIISI